MKHNVGLVGLTHYPNFGRKHDATAVTADLSHFPSKNCEIQQDKSVMTRLHHKDKSLSNSLQSEESFVNFQKQIINAGQKN